MVKFVVVLALLGTLVGCAAREDVPDERNARNREFFAHAADQAESQGANAEQVEVLREAARTGELTGAMIMPLFEPYFQCLHDNGGGEGEIFGTLELAPGIEIPSYRVKVSEGDVILTEDDINRLSDVEAECSNTYMGHAWKAIQLQPSTMEAWEQDFDRRRPHIMDCLADNGHTVDEDATHNEIIDAATQVMDAGGPHCMDA